MEERVDLIGRIWRDNRWLYFVPGFLLGLLFFPAVEIVLRDVQQYFPEVVGIIVTVGIIDVRIRQQERAREEREWIAKLIWTVGKTDNTTALNALSELRDLGSLTGFRGNLGFVDWANAKLREANLRDAKLKRAILTGADLAKARLDRADLSDSFLGETNLDSAFLPNVCLQRALLNGTKAQNALFRNADLRGATLINANLKNTHLVMADFRGASLYGANLEGAAIFDPPIPKGLKSFIAFTEGRTGETIRLSALFDEKTLLPDGSSYKLELGIDQLLRFTDPDHSDFWQPDR